MIFLNFNKIFFLFFFFVIFAKGSSSEEIIEILEDGLAWRKTQILPREISDDHVKQLKKFSSEELLQAYISYFERFDEEGKLSKMKSRVGGPARRILLVHDDVIEDVSFLRKQMPHEKDPRRFYHLSRLAITFTKARGEDFIPEMFNALFRDGRISREEGEYTPDYADDVSKLAVAFIEGSLKMLKADYTPLSQLDRSKVPYHKDEVDHLANWLIENWPGCEDFNFSDRNLLNVSKKRLSDKRLEKAEHTVDLEEQSTKGISWPFIVSILLVLGTLSFWGINRLKRA